MDTKLRQLQLTQLEILKIVDSICRKHDIPYSLYAGSLLGAARHQGFIPWDDDLDICMARSDYNRFLNIWPKEAPEGYILQNKENSPEFTQSFTKIRKDNTTFLQDVNEIGRYHTGIFLDIFPLDRAPKEQWKLSLFRWNCLNYQLLTREFVPPKGSFPIKLFSGIILFLTKKSKRERKRQQLLKKITRFSDRKDLPVIAIDTVSSLRVLYPSDMLNEYVHLPFEDGSFSCFKQWDKHLQLKFGNYMQLPPEEERTWKHHPVLIDFEHNYEELIGRLDK